MPDYVVQAVADGELPRETDWAIARVPTGTYLFIKRSRFADMNGLCALLASAWVATAAAATDFPMPIAG